MTPLPPGPELQRMGGQALVEVLDTLLSSPATEVQRVSEAVEAANGLDLLATVALIGKGVSGAVRLRIPEAFARHAAGVLLGAGGTGPHTQDPLGDLTGELGNMVAGRVASALGRSGHPCSLGLPEVVRSPPVEGAPGGTPWSCLGYVIRIDVCCHHRPT